MRLQIGPTGRSAQRGRKLYGLDIETSCAVVGCEGKHCDHALNYRKNKIDVIAVSDGLFDERVFRGAHMLTDFALYINEINPVFTAHYGKFDVGTLLSKGVTSLEERWIHDSHLLAFTFPNKIPDMYLEDYATRRSELNKTRKHKFRTASHHSLKTLAPYFLEVPPFWEPDTGFDNDEYVTLDARYSLKLTEYFLAKLESEHSKALDFYEQRYLPWTKNLLQMELDGITINQELLLSMWDKTVQDLALTEEHLKNVWADAFAAYATDQVKAVERKYDAMAKTKKTPKAQAMVERNRAKALDKVEPLNLSSPAQLTWLLRDYLGYDITSSEGDGESTGAETLERLATKDEGVKALLKHRGLNKLATSFFPEYQNYMEHGKIHTTLNSATARTGRLSSSNPNLQQVPGDLHELFIASPGHVLITKDLSAIEPTILAYFSEDPELCKLMISKGDFHGTNAQRMFDLECDPLEVKAKFKTHRDIAKLVGLAVLYGAGWRRVFFEMTKAGFTDVTEGQCKAFVKRLREFYAGVWEFKQKLDGELERGAVLYNLLGRPFKIQVASDVYMKGLNTLIQGSASDLLQQGAYELRQLGFKPLLLVHDEVIIEVQEPIGNAEKIIEDTLTTRKLPTAYGNIPIRVEGKVAKSWQK